ncbi:MAG TPA: hypothetical protein VFF06_07355 [Polyangia bacterium]|nr:hypothetical protein [Polyangia bacterium]
MPKTTPITIAELAALLPRIAATAQLLDGLARRHAKSAGAPAKGRGPGRKKRSSRTRAGSSALRDKLLAALKGKKGLPLGDIVKKVGAPRSAVKYQLRQLRSQKKARVVGDRKKARWFAT